MQRGIRSAERALRVLSGGQTGADRGGLDAALDLGIPIGGWCSKGRGAEDGTIPSVYQLEETASRSYQVRTAMNVRNSDATIVFAARPGSPGTVRTIQECVSWSKPMRLVVPPLLEQTQLAAAAVVAFLRSEIRGPLVTINVSGNRESVHPGIHETVRAIMRLALSQIALRGARS